MYNVTLFKPDHPRFKILDSYYEVAETVFWGLNSLGISCELTYNKLASDRRNIIFGWAPLTSIYGLDVIPKNSILYNLEQYSETKICDTPLKLVSDRFQIWDYCKKNIDRWLECGASYRPFWMPICYAPTLEKLTKSNEDLDSVFIGSLGPNRSERLRALASHVNRTETVVATNIWGTKRDDLISRARVMLNISEHDPKLKIFEIVRTSFYVANRKLTLAERVPGIHVEDDILDCFVWADGHQLSTKLDELIGSPEERKRLAEKGYDIFRMRDIRHYLSKWLSEYE
jgi:hypothetical protein